MTKRCQECVDLYPGAPCPAHAVPRPAPEVIKMYCDHGLVPPGGCKACYDENTRNWDPQPDWVKYGLVEDPLTDYGNAAKRAVRLLTRAGRHLQRQAGGRFWYEKDTQEAVKLLFVRASDIRKENGIIPPD